MCRLIACEMYVVCMREPIPKIYKVYVCQVFVVISIERLLTAIEFLDSRISYISAIEIHNGTLFVIF